MFFAIGYIAGISTSILIFVILTYFKRVLEQKMTTVEKRIQSAGPAPKGFIVEPDSDAERKRKEIIEFNKRHGKDTPLSDLM